MNISVEGGGLCSESENRFGNYIFAENLIRALSQYDKKNNYGIYSFCEKPADICISKNWEYKVLLPKRFWIKFRVSLEELLRPTDIFLALNQAVPFYLRAKVISFCHGLSYYYFPKLYSNSYRRLFSQLNPMMKKSHLVVVSSIQVKQELQKLYPENNKIMVIPYGIPYDMGDEMSHPKIRNRKEYFLTVGMDHPIKNMKFIRKAFEEFRREKRYKNYRLICLTGGATRSELKRLYQEATAYLTTSYYESFNLPVLEALSQNCPVIGLKSAIIPEMKEYVYVISSKKELVEGMKLAVEGRLIKIDTTLLNQTFSWSSYVKKLLELY